MPTTTGRGVEDSTGNILQYDLVAAYDTFEEIDVILNGFNAQPSGFIIDSEDDDVTLKMRLNL